MQQENVITLDNTNSIKIITQYILLLSVTHITKFGHLIYDILIVLTNYNFLSYN